MTTTEIDYESFRNVFINENHSILHPKNNNDKPIEVLYISGVNIYISKNDTYRTAFIHTNGSFESVKKFWEKD